MTRLIALVATCGLFVGCDPGADAHSDGPGSSNPDWYMEGGEDPEPVTNPFAGGPECGFDTDLQGKGVGDHIGNLGLPDQYLHKKWLHTMCGTETKALWIIAAAAW